MIRSNPAEFTITSKICHELEHTQISKQCTVFTKSVIRETKRNTVVINYSELHIQFVLLVSWNSARQSGDRYYISNVCLPWHFLCFYHQYFLFDCIYLQAIHLIHQLRPHVLLFPAEKETENAI